MSRLLQPALLLLVSLSISQAQKYVVHDLFGTEPFIENELGHRFMQSANGRLDDLNATDSICHVDAPKYECFLGTRIDADDGSWTTLDFRVKCTLDPIVAFDFRRSQECSCLAYLEHSDPNRESKTCFCSVCPMNFGRSPIAIDCEGSSDEDPFIIAGCSSLDCGFGCNGTCSFDCVQSGPECEFCAPTAAPTFQGQGSGAHAVFATTAILVAVLGLFL